MAMDPPAQVLVAQEAENELFVKSAKPWRSCRAKAFERQFFGCFCCYFVANLCLNLMAVLCSMQGAGRIPWGELEVAQVARGIVRELPLTAVELLERGEWKGGNIIAVDSALQRANAAECATNFHYLKPVLEHSPDKVPSGYFLTDVFLYVDLIFKGNLLVNPSPDQQKDKMTIAAEEAVKLKRLVSTIRGLWRSSETGNHPRVSELKSMLRPSPRKVTVV
ncbi:unnamed protein product [Durusdinium trenchii]|uniref:Uncharacterized protein n=2 Tax=Durusdinium trenchii TaxID=1381693 RepID=A0ABP0PQ98_9DINO